MITERKLKQWSVSLATSAACFGICGLTAYSAGAAEETIDYLTKAWAFGVSFALLAWLSAFALELRRPALILRPSKDHHIYLAADGSTELVAVEHGEPADPTRVLALTVSTL